MPTDSMNIPMAVLRVMSQVKANTKATIYNEKGRIIQPCPRNAYRLVGDLDPEPIGDQLGNPTAGNHQDQRGHHGLNSHIGNQHPIPQTTEDGDKQRRNNHQPKRLKGVIGICDEKHFILKRGWIHQNSRHRSRNRHDSAHGKIHPAGGNDQRHANGQEHHGRAISEDVDQASMQVAIPVFDGEETGDKDKIKEQNERQSNQREKEPALCECSSR